MSAARDERDHVTGIGGVFLRARDPAALAGWYEQHLVIPLEEGQTYGLLTDAGTTVWSAFPHDTSYWPASQQVMVNYRVRDLDTMLAQLREAGVDVDEATHELDGIGRFGWATDPEGNRFELWEPATPGDAQ